MPTRNDKPSVRVTRSAGARGGVAAAVLCALALCAPAWAAGVEVHSNGRGGGEWSDPETWHGGQVPGPEDTVVIAMRDTVIFDADHTDTVSCRALYLDPEAVLRFDDTPRRLALTVAGPIESYGTIRMDTTESRRAEQEIRLVAESESDRVIRLLQHAGILIYGNEQHRRGDRTARLIAGSLDPDADRLPARLVVDGEAMFDLHHARVHDVDLRLANLDNSGGSRDRLNIIGNLFTGSSSLRLEACDTPVVRNNHFHTDVALPFAIQSVGNALGQFRGNVIEGPYDVGLSMNPDNNSSISDTIILGVQSRGIYLRSGRDTSFRNVRIDGGGRGEGVWLQSLSSAAVLQGVHVENVERGFRIRHSRAQLTDCSAEGLRVADEDDPGVGIHLHQSAVRLINSPFDPDQMDVDVDGGTRDGDPFVETMQYVVVRVRRAGDSDREGATHVGIGAGVQVHLQTAEESGGVPSGRADLNVRNSPAMLSADGYTPRPATQQALVVRSWRIDPRGRLQQAPFYDLLVRGPSDSDESGYETLAEELIEPRADWFRADLNDRQPTVEVVLP